MTTLLTMKGFNKKIEYLCFTANTAGSQIRLYKQSYHPTELSLETSIDGKTWTDYTINTYLTLANVGDKVYFRNKSTTDTGFSLGIRLYYSFQINGSIGASGDITYLLNKNGTTTLSDYCFINLFTGLSNLTTAPSLPATTLANYCYYSMFEGCTSLTTLPKLPATTLANYCYYRMFFGCSNIKLSTTQTGEYQTPYRIPTEGTGTNASGDISFMFQGTGGSFQDNTPTINTTYYTSNTVI